MRFSRERFASRLRAALTGAALLLTAVATLATSESDSSDPGWRLSTTLEGPALLLDDVTVEVMDTVEVELVPTTIDDSRPVSGLLTLEVMATWVPPAADPGAVAPSIMVGLAQGFFEPQGEARASGTPTTEPTTLTATRGALISCNVGTGCLEEFHVHFAVEGPVGGGSIELAWTLSIDVDGTGRTTPPPGADVTLTLVEASP